MNLKEIFTPEKIEYFKTHKEQITSELLQNLRQHGNEGKQIALDILDTEMSPDNYYLDAFGKKIFFMGDRNLKRAYTSMNLSPIHIEEIKRCSADLKYFMDNYIKIRTKKGYNFPELRAYQQRFIDVLNSDYESIVAMLGRQAGKSVTVAIFMCWHFNFNHDLNIGICANKGSLAREFLNNVKEMFYSMPMWMRQGVTAWTKGSIESELKMRILTDVPGEYAFRGFSISLLCMDECISGDSIITVRNKTTKIIEKITVKELYERLNYKDFEVLTSNGFKDFDNVVFKGQKKGLVIKTKNHSISVTENHKFYINGNFVYAKDLNLKDKIQTDNGLEEITEILETNDSYYDLINVSDGHHFTANGIEVSNCAWLPANKFSATMDSILPSQSAMSWKKNIFISTPNGMNHFYDLVMGSRKRKVLYDLSEEQIQNLKDKVLSKKDNGNGLFDVTIDKPSNNMALFEMDWQDVPRYNSKGQRITPNEFKDDIVAKNGLTFFNQNYACDFIGSSYTLVSADSLKRFTPKDPLQVIANRLKVFEEPQKGHKYIMGVDPAKFGADSFAIQILDVSTFPFIQVASARLPNENFQIMPEFIYDWGEYYNEAFLIIENNDGAGTYINTVLHTDYEYENLFFEKTFDTYKNHSKTKIEPGFRTNVRNRALILDVLKLLIDNQKLIVNDAETIKEFNTFVLKNNKYQADDGFHDDLIMALGIALALFGDSKNFENISEMTKKLYSNDSGIEFTDYLCLGSFDDFSDSESFSEQNTIDPLETFELNGDFKTW